MNKITLHLDTIGWVVSLLLHGAILFLGGYWIITQPQFAIATGKISTEVELVADSSSSPPQALVTAPATRPPISVQSDRMKEPTEVPDLTPNPQPKSEEGSPPSTHEPASVFSSKTNSIKKPIKTENVTRAKSTMLTSSTIKKSVQSDHRQSPSSVDSGKSRPSNKFRNHGITQASPDYLKNPPPIYPKASRLARQQGTVLLSVTVSDSGTSLRVKLLRSSGFPALDDAALKAVRSWKFRPATAGGVNVSSEVNVPIRFELN